MRQTLLFLSLSILVLASCQKSETIDSNISARPGGGNGGGGSTVNLTQGLVAFYPFNGNANDESGNSNNGSVYGATLTTDRFNRRNRAYRFNNNLITAPYRSYLAFSYNNSFSVSFWAMDMGGGTDYFIGNNSNFSQSDYWQIAEYVSTNGGGYAFNTAENYSIYGAFSQNVFIPLNSWFNMIGTYSAGNWNLFLNGNLIASNSVSIDFNNDLNTQLTIGKSGTSASLNGKMDDIRIYNRPLTQAEITYLARN